MRVMVGRVELEAVIVVEVVAGLGLEGQDRVDILDAFFAFSLDNALEALFLPDLVNILFEEIRLFLVFSTVHRIFVKLIFFLVRIVPVVGLREFSFEGVDERE